MPFCPHCLTISAKHAIDCPRYISARSDDDETAGREDQHDGKPPRKNASPAYMQGYLQGELRFAQFVGSPIC